MENGKDFISREHDIGKHYISSQEMPVIPHISLFLFSFRSILSKDGVLYVKLRAGQLSYKEDPMGWQSLLAQTVANRNSEARAFKVVLIGRNDGREGIVPNLSSPPATHTSVITCMEPFSWICSLSLLQIIKTE